ncbi:hypothetical protein MHUMG1_07089 [Metarhizium humberi]|uniref:Transcription factor, FAR1-related protein n=1 Tax=Metarhizium humberi TaxID=2596975 RepID=A0A9P8S6I2_9HYPO|nr:hypothetical protein MHUMG1_07089 [Metarhizium humberi]
MAAFQLHQHTTMSSLSLQPSYATAEAAIGAINTIQASEGFVTVKSGGGYSRRTGLRNFYYIRCQHSGSYRPSTSNSNIYKTSSRKSQCPFKAQVRLNPHGNTWVPVIKDSQHNHEPVLSPLDSSILRLRSQQNYGLEKIQSRVKTLSQMKTLTAKQIAARIMSECPNVYIIDTEVFFMQRQLRPSNHNSGTSAQNPASNQLAAEATSQASPRASTPASSDTPASTASNRGGIRRRGRGRQRHTMASFVARVAELEQLAGTATARMEALANAVISSHQAAITAIQASQAPWTNLPLAQSRVGDFTGSAPVLTSMPSQALFGDPVGAAAGHVQFVQYEPPAQGR